MIARMIGWLLAVGLWELLTLPATSVSPSRGAGISLVVILLSAYQVARHTAQTSNLFVYGCVATVLFVPRFFSGRFSLWADHQAPADELLFLGLVIATVGLGIFCWGAAELRHSMLQLKGKPLLGAAARPAPDEAVPLGDFREADRRPLGIRHLLLWTTCSAVYFAASRLPEDVQRIFAEQGWLAWHFARNTAYGISAGAALMTLPLFVARRYRHIPFPVHPGEFLLFANGVSVAAAYGQYQLVAMAFPEAEPTNAAYFLAPLIFILAARSTANARWRRVLYATLALHVLSVGLHLRPLYTLPFFEGGHAGLLRLPNLAAEIALLLVVLIVLPDVRARSGYPWLHRLGIATTLLGRLVAIATVALGVWALMKR